MIAQFHAAAEKVADKKDLLPPGLQGRGRTLKRILIAREISKVLLEKKSYLNRAEIRLFTSASNDEAFDIHRLKHVDLIIADRDAPGISTDELCSLVRKDPKLLHAAIIVVCACDPAQMSRSIRNGADAVILKPIKPSFVLAKAQQLLHIPWRQTYRVPLDVTVDGKISDGTFSCRSLDISMKGLLVETKQTFAIGERVVCSFILPDSTLIRARGEVVRNLPSARGTQAKRFGIHFRDLTPEEGKAIEAFLDSPALKKRSAIY